MAKGLLTAILTHGFAQGYWQKGSVLLDPFGGVSTTAILGTYAGLKVCTVELEDRFWRLGLDNVALHRPKWNALGRDPAWPVLLQGDARELPAVLRGAQVGAVVGSPPFIDTLGQDTRKTLNALWHGHGRTNGKTGGVLHNIDYGTTTGQLGAMPAGSLAAVLNEERQKVSHRTPKVTSTFDTLQNTLLLHKHCISSISPASITQNCPHSHIAGNVQVILSSPPYAGTTLSGGPVLETGSNAYGLVRAGQDERQRSLQDYGTTTGQLGAESPQTFWAASRQIVQHCFDLLVPNGIAVWVCKDYIRASKRVPFSDDWRKLNEACGFTLVEWIHASLIEDYGTELDLFGGGEARRTIKRAGFFRKLAEKKYAADDPRRINHEDVLIFRKGGCR